MRDMVDKGKVDPFVASLQLPPPAGCIPYCCPDPGKVLKASLLKQAAEEASFYNVDTTAA